MDSLAAKKIDKQNSERSKPSIQGDHAQLTILAQAIQSMSEAACVVSAYRGEPIAIAATNPAFEQFFKHSAEECKGMPLASFFETLPPLSFNQAQSTPCELAYQSPEGPVLSIKAQVTAFEAPNGSENLGLMVLKDLDTLTAQGMNRKTQDALIQVLQDFLANHPFQEAVTHFLKFLVHTGDCLQASLWWRSIYAPTQAPLRPVASVGEDTFSGDHIENLATHFLQCSSPEPGFVVHEKERGSVYALPLYAEEGIRGVLFLLSNTTPFQNTFSRYSRFLGQVLGLQLERKLLSQCFSEWVFHSPDPMMLSDSQGTLYHANTASRKLFDEVGEEREDHSQIPTVWDYVHPCELERFKKEYRILASEGQALFEGRCVSRLGEEIYVSWKMALSPEGDLIYHVIQNTSRTHMLTQRLQQAYALAKMGTWESDMEHSLVYWSPMVRKIYEIDDPHYKPAFTSGLSYFLPEDRPLIEAAVQNCIEKGTPWDLQLRILTEKNSEKWVRTLGEGEFEDGKCKHLFGIFVDIDATKRGELAQKKQTELLALLNRVHQQFLSTHWRVVLPEALDCYQKVLDLDAIMYIHGTHALGDLDNVFLPDEGLAPSLSAHVELLDLIKTLLPETLVCYAVQSLPHHLCTHFTSLSLGTVCLLPVFSAGVLQGALLVGVGPTASSRKPDPDNRSFLQTFAYSLSQAIANQKSLESLKSLNAELEENMKALAYSNQELEQFAYIASHDLQEPLRMVTSFLNQLEKKYNHVLDEKAQRYIYFAVDGARRMRQVILDLLDYSRLGKPDQVIYEQVLTEDLLAEIRVLLRKKIQETQAEINSDLPPVLFAPSLPLRQVLQNLIENALKYRKPDTPPTLFIRLQDMGDDWCFSVEDNGIGIEAEYFEKIFSIFQRLHSKDKYEGTGVGLALCKKIVEQCQGKIWVDSTVGQGSTFYFQISKGDR